MPDIGYASMPVIPTFKGLQSDLEKGSSKALTAAGASGGDKFGRSASKAAGSRFRGAAKGIVAPLVGAFAAVQVGSFFKDSVAEARESQKVGAITARVIKTTGKAAKVTAKQVGDLSTAISNKTGIDDEAVQSAANLLLTFTNVRNEVGKGNKVFDQATRLATDMGAALGGDPKSAAIQLGKALNDPVKGITALSRVGVSFTQQQKDQIGTLVKSGNTLKAQKVILGELSKEFGGTAAASSTAGEKASVAFGNIKESIGTALLPAIDDLENAFLKKGVPAIQKFVQWAQDKGVPAVKKFARVARPLVEDVLTKTRDILKDAMPYAEGFVDAFNKLPKGVKTGLAATAVLGFGASKVPGVKGATGAGAAAVKGIFGLVSKTKPLPVFVVNNGGGIGGTPGGSKPKVPPVPLLGALAIPLAIGAGGVAATKANKKDAAAFSPGIGGYAGDGGMGLPAGALDFSEKKTRQITTNIVNGGHAIDKLPAKFERGMTGAQALASQVFGIERGANRSRSAVISLTDALEAARQRAIQVEQAVSVARSSKIDGQLGRGGVTVIHNGNIVAPDPRAYHADAQRRTRRAATDGIRSRP